MSNTLFNCKYRFCSPLIQRILAPARSQSLRAAQRLLPLSAPRLFRNLFAWRLRLFLFASLLLLHAAPSAFPQAWSGIIDPSRAVDWSHAGVTGGVDQYANRPLCQTVYNGSGAPTSSLGVNGDVYWQTNTSASWKKSSGAWATTGNALGVDIAGAINACPSGTYVLISAGTYTSSTGITITTSNVTLRGSGPAATIVNFTGTDGCAGNGGGDICVIPSSNFFWQGSQEVIPVNPSCTTDPPCGSHTATWSAGSGTFPQGTTSIQVSNIGSAGISNGQMIILDQANDGAVSGTLGDTNSIFVCDYYSATTNSCKSEGPAGNDSDGRTINSADYSQTQLVQVVSGCSSTCTGPGPFTITITPGIYMNNWRSGQTPGVWWSNRISGIGIENITFNHCVATGSCSSSAAAGMYFVDCDNCWVKNVRDENSNRNHVWLVTSSHDTIRDSYFFGTQNGAIQGYESYGVESWISSDDLIENNIFQQVASPIMFSSGEGVVSAYNFSINNLYVTPAWQQNSSTSHNTGSAMNLWEGNQFEGTIFCDDIHGTSNANTFFRNRLTGQGHNGTIVNSNNTEAASLQTHCRAYNIIGNVLGTAGWHANYESFTPNATTNDACHHTIYQLGWAAGECGTIAGGAGGVPDDNLVRSTLYRWGNYDTATAAAFPNSQGKGVRWCGNSNSPDWTTVCLNSSEVPTSNFPPFINGNIVPSNHNLPASFYLAAKPSWFGSATWPPIGPDVTSGDSSVGGHANNIPAQVCWNNFNSAANQPTDGSGTVLSFDANTCYGSSGAAPTMAQTPQVSLSYSVSTNSVTFTGLSAGQTIAGFLIWTLPPSVTLINITDNCGSGGGSDVYTLLHNPTAIQNGGSSSAEYWGIVGTSGSCTITANFSGSTNSAFAVVPVSGANATAPVDQSGINGSLGYDNYNAADSATSGSVTTTAANELVLGFFEASGSFAWTAGTGFTADVNNGADHMLEHKTLPSPGSVAATAQNTNTTSAYPGALILTLKP